MKDKLNNAFKDTPQRFSYTVESTLSQVQQKKTKKRLSTPLRVIIAVILIFAILPSTVFGAVKIYGTIAQRVGVFGIAFDVQINEEVPQYLKMKVDVPEGFKEQPNSAGLKYDRDVDEWEFGFTILPMRFYENVDYTALETNVKDYNKIKIASRESFELVGTDDYRGLARYYVWYEEANVLMLIFRGETVTDEELENFVDCISFTKGTEADHDTFFEPENSKETDDAYFYEYERSYEEIPLDTEVVFAGFCESTQEGGLKVKSTITDVRITDTLDDIDKGDINPLFASEKLVDSKGKLLSKEVEIWQNGDGIETESKLISCESMTQSLILIDIEYENTTQEQVEIYIPHRLETLAKENDRFVFTTIIDRYQEITASEYCDTEVFYLTSHGDNEKDFYIPTLKPNETKTITLGFRCVDEQLENAYIVLNPVTDGVITPEYSNNANTYWIFKVQ